MKRWKPLLYCWENERSSLISLFITFYFLSVQKSKVCISFSPSSLVSHATVSTAFAPVPLLCACPSPKASDVCKCDSGWQFEVRPLLVLHLWAGLMLVGRVGSSLCEGWNPVMVSKHGIRPSLTAQSFKTRVLIFFFFFKSDLHHFIFPFLSSSLLFCSVAAASLVINSSLNSMFHLCFNLPKRCWWIWEKHNCKANEVSHKTNVFLDFWSLFWHGPHPAPS